jgi:molybdenum cofactor synthesis domain-containing protein
MKVAKKAVLIIIGSEILSGRTLDINTQFIAKELANLGIKLIEVRIIEDNKQSIIETIKYFHPIIDLIFTTGGIGPTHDDITSQAIAEAFGRKYIKNSQAEQLLVDRYKENINEAKLKMAYMPENVQLIENKISKAPGFIIENVYVMAGVPKIMQAMFEAIKHSLPSSDTILSESEEILIGESIIAKKIEQIQLSFPEVEVGSYPFDIDGSHATSIVMRSTNKYKLSQCHQEVINVANQYIRLKK